MRDLIAAKTQDRPSAEIVAILEQLIAFDTVSKKSNLELIEWTEAYLARYGVVSQLTYDVTRCKANLFATVGDGRAGGLVLSGHTDVVPIDGQVWSSEPFRAETRDGRIYGRGAADMKGFIAAVLAAVPAMCSSGMCEPIHLAFSFDEEVGCLGIGGLLEDLAARNIRPRGCIIGEPTEMQVVIGHKGGSVYRCSVRGREVHASLAPRGINAIEYAARLIVRLRDIQERLSATERRNTGFDIPYTTLSANLVHGGSASNIVPNQCEFRVDVRSLPWTAVDAVVAELEAYARDDLLPEMRTVAPESEIVIERTGNVPSLDIDDDAELTCYVRRLLGNCGKGQYVGFGTEGGIFQNAGIPAVICGPGSIAQAHRPDEFVSLGDLAQCEQFLKRLIDDRAQL